MERYDSYKDSGVEWIGEIPSHWECLRLGMLGSFSSSGIDKKSTDDEEQVKMVNYTDLVRSRVYNPVQSEGRAYMRVTTPRSKLEEHRLSRGDLVMIPSSETREDLGYSSLIDFESSDTVFSYHILRFQFRRNVYHYFKKYLINHHSVLSQFSSEGKGTTRQIIGRYVVNNVRVVIPPLHEQEQIVEYLDRKTTLIDSLIEKTVRKIELLKEKRTSLINEVVTKGLNSDVEMKDSGVEWIGEIPSHFRLVRLRYLCDVSTGGKDTKDAVEDGDYEFYVRSPKIERIDSYSFDGEAVLTVGDGAGTGKVFHHVIGKFDFHQRVYKFSDFKGVRGRFFYFFMLHHFIFVTENQNSKSTVDSLRRPLIDNFWFVVPPLHEQEQIVEYLDEQTSIIDSTITAEEKRIELLKEYRQSLISEVVTGKVMVATPECQYRSNS